MPGYNYKFVDKVKKKFICYLCRLPMRDPVQITTCGHRFCDTCLQEFLSEGLFICPEDHLPLDYATIYPDPELQMEINEGMVRCMFYTEGCTWIDRLHLLQAHLEDCRYNNVLCPNDCSTQLSRMALEDHLHYTCPRRQVTCEFCSQEFSGELMESHQGNCLYETIWCENKCGARLQRRFLSNHMRNECHKRTLPCQYCQKEFVYETLQDHYYRCPRFPMMCPNRCDPTKIPREDIDKHVNEQCPSASIPCPFKEAGCQAMCPRYQQDKHLEESMKEHLTLMCNLVKDQKETITFLNKRLKLLSQVSDGVMIWRIDDFKAKMADAKLKVDLEMRSDSFYTSRYGYHMCASAFLNGNGTGEGKYLSLYIKVLPGEYDNILEWPFQLPISFTVLDQCSDPEKRLPVRESFIPNPSWKHFQKPSGDRDSMGFGYPKFVSHETLLNGTYIKDDTIFLRIKVDTHSVIIR